LLAIFRQAKHPSLVSIAKTGVTIDLWIAYTRVSLENRSRNGVPPKPSFEKHRNAASSNSHPAQSRALLGEAFAIRF